MSRSFRRDLRPWLVDDWRLTVQERDKMDKQKMESMEPEIIQSLKHLLEKTEGADYGQVSSAIIHLLSVLMFRVFNKA